MSIINRSQVSAVSPSTSINIRNTDKPFILLLNEGDNLFEGILDCAEAVNLQAAIFTGLGALANITIGYYHLETKQHQSKLFEGVFELVSLTGNITFAEEGKRFAHIHAAIGDTTCQVFGGHLIDAYAGASTEISIIPLHSPVHRKYNDALDIRVICT